MSAAIAAPVAAYRARLRRQSLLVACMAAAMATAFAWDLATGPGALAPADILATLLRAEDQPMRLRVIVWEIRLPVATMALLVGAMLGLAGAQMQTILANPLADPFTLGISTAA